MIKNNATSNRLQTAWQFWSKLCHQRRSSVAVMFALSVLPLLALTGLAVDFSAWNQAHAMLTRAANSAALNAVKVAANAQLRGDPNYLAEGETAGEQWFASQISGTALGVNPTAETVVLNAGPPITATVTYNGSVGSIFGEIFGVTQYALPIVAVSSVETSPYLNIYMMLDNSTSMEIGATSTDMGSLAKNSPCDASYAGYPTATAGYNPVDGYYTIVQDEANSYANFQCNGLSSVGGVQCPVTGTNPVVQYKPTTNPSQYWASSTCTNLPKQKGAYPVAGPPCALACHSDGSAPAGLGNDTFAMARRNNITLRIDLLKTATKNVISAMQTDNNPTLNNLKLGIFTFNTVLSQVYPSSGGVGYDWAEASTDVGGPGGAGKADTGFQPPVAQWVNNNNTYFTSTMNTLAAQLTNAGDGSTPDSPMKALFLITDGLEDDQNRSAINTSACQKFKDMGYTVYVVYTTYYPVMHSYYFDYLQNIVQGTGINSLSYNLQACASSSDDYIEASDIDTLNNALQSFLISALNAPVRFTK